jgi:surface protein
MGISDRKRSIEVSVNINLDLNEENIPNGVIVQNNFKSGGFVSRKKSGNIIAGSKLNVDGQGIFNVKVNEPNLNKNIPKSRPVSEGNPPPPTQTNQPTPTPTPTVQTPFISVWRTTGVTESITLPITGNSNSGIIDWGDGTTSPNDVANKTHTYSLPGDYTVKIYGTVNSWSFNNSGDKLKIREILQWGDNTFFQFTGTFYGCSNLVLTNVTGSQPTITNATFMFADCTSITTINNLNSWNMSSITDTTSMFQNCSSFNQSLSGWNVSNVVNTSSMFYKASSFNQSINNWNVSGVTNMNRMFRDSIYNQPLSGWNVSNVTNMSEMFMGSSFNQPIGNWNVSNVTTMFYMFPYSNFNQNINGWNVSNVTNMNAMFAVTNFDQPLSGWNVSNVTDMGDMFAVTYTFNQSIGNWNVSNVTNMFNMFGGSYLFNQPLSGWNVSNVTNMSNMFSCNFHQTPFNQDIGNWNISGVTNFTDFMYGKLPSTFSAANLNSIYNGWSTKNPYTGLNINFGSVNYTTSVSQAGKNVLLNTYGWTITDGGGI